MVDLMQIISVIVITVQLLIGILTIETPLQIMSVLIPCYSCWYLWFYDTTQKLRVGNILANLAWAIYNLCSGLYIVLIMRAITVSSNLIAYIKYNCRNEKSGNPVQDSASSFLVIQN